ncbi:MAG: hypothetical protein ACR2P1_16310 [Pseudomonadales bacterium]
MSAEALAANLATSGAGNAKQMGSRVSPQDIAKFENAYKDASSRQIQAPNTAAIDSQSNKTVSSLLDPFLKLNTHAAELGQQASLAQGKELKPSELMMLTMRSHEFMFHCELVSNVANRSSDGMQQLFRQQS